ncbi:MAG: SusC/RagA family TonB-linked outer membrane protein [Cyclobacteriaceae bacterium]|nr:SusC/RagA family TonB-linked outer membrane protein [Cyclobacteriaceae bacterium]
MKKCVHEKFMFMVKVSIIQLVIIGAVLSLAHAGNVSGQEILDKRISVQFKNTPLRVVLEKIEKTADVRFLFYSQVVPENDKITIQFRQESLRVILDRILLSRKVKYEADGDQIILTRQNSSEGSSQSKVQDELDHRHHVAGQVYGQVLDEFNQPLPGVNVLVKGTTNGTTTDVEGKFSLNNVDKQTTLVFSFIGYISKEVLVGDMAEINISLTPDIATLSEVVVVGYGTQKKSDIISSISSVDGSDLNIRATANFESGLQGLAAGVSVQSQSGTPGAPVKVLIRGTNSINLSTDPLYIIDGMPISVSASGLGSSNLSPMALINQNDIESIQILKDAAATAIYGSRGSNGVIIVTTKSGKKGDGSIQFNYSTGVSNLTRTPEDVGFANTKEWFQIMDKAYLNSSGDTEDFDMMEYYNNVPMANIPLASPKLTREQAEAINTNWYDELFRVGTFQNFNLSASQGTENTSFYISSNYRKDNGVQNFNSLDRFTIRTNLDFNPSKNLSIGTKLTFGYTKNDQRASGITSISVDALPWLPIYELDNPNRYYNAYTQSNALAVRDPENLLDRVEQYRGLGGVSLNYRIPAIQGLSLRTELSGDVLQSNRVVWQSGDIRADATNTKSQSAASEESITYTGMNYNLYGSYDRTFNNHSINLVGGAEATRSYQYIRAISGTGLTGKYQEIGSPTNLISIRGQKEYERYLLGFFGRANYKFKDRYLAGVSIRRDGSSVFTSENRWGTFVAVSGGWIISEENFMSFLNGNTFLKLRGSYGETGNQSIPENLNVVQYNKNPVVYGSKDIKGVNGTVPINIAVTNLQWESTKSSDIGLDFGLFSNRLNGSLAYYHRFVDGMLLQAGLPYSAGVSSMYDLQLGQGSYDKLSTIWGNFGDMVNSGVELELHALNYDKKGFKWTTDFNIGFNQNVIKKLTADIDQSGGGLENIYQNTISRKGDRRAVWYIADYAGVDPASGVPLIYARDQSAFEVDGSTQRLKNGVGEDILLPATITNIRANRFYQNGKSGDPKYQGGITNTLQYRGFDFSFLFVFSGGNYILDYDRQQATIVNPTHAILKEVYDQSWQAPGDEAKYPQLRSRFTYRYKGQDISGFSGSESYHNGHLYKADFIRLRNVMLGYALPPSVLGKMKLKSARLYIAATNLLTFTKYPGFDPESAGAAYTPGFVYYSNAIPQLITFTVGADIKF